MNKDFLDNGQYKKHSIMKYEAVFGKNFISPGGRKIAYQFIKKLKLKKNMIVPSEPSVLRITIFPEFFGAPAIKDDIVPVIVSGTNP